MLKITPTRYILKEGYNEKWTGKRVIVDAVKSDWACKSGILVRIINMGTKPAWFDSGWVQETKDQ